METLIKGVNRKKEREGSMIKERQHDNAKKNFFFGNYCPGDRLLAIQKQLDFLNSIAFLCCSML